MIDKLVNYLKQCDDAYYTTSNPLVSDDTYDALVENLRRLDPVNPYLSKVGAEVRSRQIGRVIPMGTLSKYHQNEEVLKWLSSESGKVLVAPKYDGFAIELVYKDGVLVTASTRGTQYVGEDVREAVRYIPDIPETIPDMGVIIVRGEAIIPVANHEKVKSFGYEAMRNAVPGIVRGCRKDVLPYVDYVAYEFIDGRGDRVSQRSYWCKYFFIEDCVLFSSEDFEGILKHRESLRASTYLYELDGVVLKTVEIKEDDLSCPKHLIAWKYKSNRESTTFRGIEYQMGVTGYFTPVGLFDTVVFQGAKLVRASLGNITRMRKEFDGLTVGSIVEVSRRGDIIPYIEALTLKNEEGEIIELPRVCPHCGQPLADVDSEPHCINPSCPERLRLQILQYTRSIGIKGIGEGLVTSLISNGYISDLKDIYEIDPTIIATLPRQGESSVDKWRALQSKKLSDLEYLSAYPFLDLGEKIWRSLLEVFTFSEILDLDYDTLINSRIKGIGESKAMNITSQIQSAKDDIRSLREYSS